MFPITRVGHFKLSTLSIFFIVIFFIVGRTRSGVDRPFRNGMINNPSIEVLPLVSAA
jgi:hypothetical protein